jgi:CheY-like chemotaxis protein
MKIEKMPRFVAIDDDSIINYVTENVIKHDYPDAEIHTFLNHENGLKFLQDAHENDEKKCVVFLDLNMPLITGWEVLDMIQSFGEAMHQRMKIYILSSSATPHDRKKAESHSLVSGYIEKPLQKESLGTLMTNLN